MRKIGLLVLFALLPLSSSLPAQPQTVSKPAPPAQTITLGDAAVALNGPWKFQPGDSPWQNGAPVWAQPGFDDSGWAGMDLAPKEGSFDVNAGAAGFVPGWTSRGYPRLTGYAWYRLRVRVKDPSRPLWLKMPLNVDDGYQLYANRHYIGGFGDFGARRVTIYDTRPLSFRLPPPGANGELELAIRFCMDRGTPFFSPHAGGMHSPPVLGFASTVRLLQKSEEDGYQRSWFTSILRTLLFLLLLPAALLAWLRNRQERAYLWLAAVLCLYVAELTQVLISIYTYLISATTLNLVQTALLDPLLLPCWLMFWWHWFGLERRRWLPRAAWIVTAAQMAAFACLNPPLYGGLVPAAWAHWLNPLTVGCRAALCILIVAVLALAFRKHRTGALLAALPVLLLFVPTFGTDLLVSFGINTQFYPFGFPLGSGTIASMLMVLLIAAMAAQRFLVTQVSQELARQSLVQEMEQARALQQRVLVPEVLHSPAFSVETEYHPAQTVGGDFFQTLSKPDGSLLVVVGDVSGKGISAAMLVAVLVGAIRTRAEESFDPGAMLTMLNQRLIGRSGGHLATCLAAELRPDGTMRIANAGHLPPYLNGQELDLAGSLPLGAADVIDPSSRMLTLEPGDRLTFLTDGVVEAMNSANELFGFERARTLSTQPAAAIVEQAQAFGQNDDITVLRIEFTGAPSEAPDEALVTA